ncbi:HU family DNA-binding protein [Caviibacter abscessus]|uniref:HU family DNA-binding protein n=1 Tax=Caviibacter abscessus TaxID=1766719 RepID=UPI0008316F64|nr:HU family DNA-binding protein [Caviibacter abscessus]
MSKKEFIEAFAAKSGENKKRSEELLNHFLNLIEENLLEDRDVQFVGWGSFSTKIKEARNGRNPKDGSVISIPAKKIVKFKAGKKLADAVANTK